MEHYQIKKYNSQRYNVLFDGKIVAAFVNATLAARWIVAHALY